MKITIFFETLLQRVQRLLSLNEWISYFHSLNIIIMKIFFQKIWIFLTWHIQICHSFFSNVFHKILPLFIYVLRMMMKMEMEMNASNKKPLINVTCVYFCFVFVGFFNAIFIYNGTIITWENEWKCLNQNQWWWWIYIACWTKQIKETKMMVMVKLTIIWSTNKYFVHFVENN